MNLSTSSITEVECRGTPLGLALYIRIWRPDGKKMGWKDVWKRFAEAYPGKWALQTFPPDKYLIDEANIYHLFVYDDVPHPNLTINTSLRYGCRDEI